MKNEVLRELMERKSVRSFTEQEIGAQEKQVILEAAVMAPTAGCQQRYTILDITDPKLKTQLSETCDHQPFIAKAPMVLVFCADCQKWYDAYLETQCRPRHPGAGDLFLAVVDTAIAAQNAVTAAYSLGIGSCYIGDILENCELHRQMLGLPDHVIPAVMVVFGYPTEQQKNREKPERAPMNRIVYANKYPDMDEAMRKELFGNSVGNKEYTEWMKAFCDRKYNSDFSREMTRSVERYLENFTGAEYQRILE